MPEIDIISAGREALRRLRRGAVWADWIAVAKALQELRSRAMRMSGTNRPHGANYHKHMGKLLRETGFDLIQPSTRCSCHHVVNNLEAVENWRASRTETERLRCSHPDAVWKMYRAANPELFPERAPHIERTANIHKPARTYQHTNGIRIDWPGQMLERGAEAIHACRSNDTLVLARKCLEAAIRGTHDIIVLLEDNQVELPRTAHRNGQAQAHA